VVLTKGNTVKPVADPEGYILSRVRIPPKPGAAPVRAQVKVKKNILAKSVQEFGIQTMRPSGPPARVFLQLLPCIIFQVFLML